MAAVMAAGTACGSSNGCRDWVWAGTGTSACLESAPACEEPGTVQGFGWWPSGNESACIHGLHVLRLVVHAFGTYVGIPSELARWCFHRQEQDKGWERGRGALVCHRAACAPFNSKSKAAQGWEPACDQVRELQLCASDLGEMLLQWLGTHSRECGCAVLCCCECLLMPGSISRLCGHWETFTREWSSFISRNVALNHNYVQ